MFPRERPFRTVLPGPAAAGNRKDETLTLRLKDLIDRLPATLLAPGDHDGNREISFEITDLARQIADGRPMLDLTEVQHQVPDLFVCEIKRSDQFHVRFPWRKLIEMLCAADTTTPAPGLTRAGALRLAQLLRGHRGPGPVNSPTRAPIATGAMSRAPQWFVRNTENSDASPYIAAQEADRALRDLVQALEPLANSLTVDHSPDPALAAEAKLAAEENERLRQEIAQRDREIDTLRKALADLEAAAIDQIAALNQHCDEIAAAAPQPSAEPESSEIPINPQHAATIESLSQQVAELYTELDRAREETLLATAAHAKQREKHEASAASAAALEEYLASVAYELERANAILKDMESKLRLAETNAVLKATELKLLTVELAEIRTERDALRGRLYALSPREPEPQQILPNGTGG